MSLVPLAMRVCTVRALQSALPPSIAVLDSPQDPLSMLAGNTPRPVVGVYTGFVHNEYKGRNLLGGDPDVALAIQFFLPATFTFDFGLGVNIKIDTRRQGAETALDVLCRKAIVALNNSEEKWAHLWREFVINTPSSDNSSYVIERESVRCTAREIFMQCSPLHEPIPGEKPILAWAELIKMMREDKGSDGLSSLADWIESEIIGPENLTKDLRDNAYLGLSRYVGSSIEVVHEVKDNSVLIDQENIPDENPHFDESASPTPLRTKLMKLET